MEIQIGCVVRPIAGRDAGLHFVVVGIDLNYVTLANGKLRKLENPKRKNIKHVRKTNIILSKEQTKTNKQLRKVLQNLDSK